MAELISIAAYKVQIPFEAPFIALREWSKRRETEKALSNLSNRELTDIGLDRGDIRAVASCSSMK